MADPKNVFVPHANLSSQVDLDVALGVITKTRSRRSVPNLLNEARALYVWDQVLTAYNGSIPECNGGQIASPKLLSVNIAERALHMTFRPGHHLGKVLSSNYDRTDSLPAVEVRQDVAYRIGSLAGLKQVEGFVHGDYDQRHLLHTPLITPEDTRRLSIIDGAEKR